MELRVAGGATLEVASKADLEAHTERIAKLLERPHARYQRLHAAKAPRAGNAPFCIKVDRPPEGMLYVVEWAIVFGDDPTVSTAIANVRAALFAGSMPADSQLSGTAPILGLDAAGVIQSGIVVPSTVTIPDKSIVYSGEELYAVIGGTGTVAGAGYYHVQVGVLELPQTAEALMW